jgi:hypothetical protein
MLILIRLTAKIKKIDSLRESWKINFTKFLFRKNKIVHLTIDYALIAHLTNITKSITRKTVGITI